MARTNKYTSLNFNDIYEKKIITTSTSSLSSRIHSSSSNSLSSIHHPNKSYSFSASSHGGMLLLSRPSPKPSPSPSSPSPASLATPPSTPPPTKSAPSLDSDSISLRPQGKIGSGQDQERETKETPTPVVIPKSDKFVPPHLRPGFVAREQKPPEFQRSSGARPGNPRPRSGHEYHGSSPNRYAEDGRPNSGGGFDRRMRGVGGCESDHVVYNRPRSGGSRPSSTG